MAEEAINIQSVTTASDGTVKLSIEKYNELLETVASQKGSISSLRDQVTKLQNQPPVVNRTVVEKTPEMLAQENKVWGGTFMGLGASMFVVGAFRFWRGVNGS